LHWILSYPGSNTNFKPPPMTRENVRVRFAPSPTGPLHLGGVRTALYNYLFARHHNGKLILRIEDTDQTRFVPTAEGYILDSFAWCGVTFDEDVVSGGPFAPYRQSERTAIYRGYVQKLIDSGNAYYAFDTEEELTLRREALKVENITFQYDCKSRMGMKNSLTFTPEETEGWLASGKPYVVRLKVPVGVVVNFSDLIRGDISVHSENIDDKVLFKSDGLPTYHLANVVDDHLMEISHVIRGEEWLPSAPLHVLLYRSFGWENSMPLFAHLPLILKPDGNGKLSKRDGDRLGFPVFPLEWTDPVSGESSMGYKEHGFLPEAFINMLALLGWNPGHDKELMGLDELTALFSIERIGKSGAKFDWEKARWFNHQYLQKKTNAELAALLEPQLIKHKIVPDFQYITKVVGLIRDRAFLVPDLWSNAWFFFIPPSSYDEQAIKKALTADTVKLVRAFAEEAAAMVPWTHDTIHSLVQDFIARNGIKTGQLMTPLRLLAVGSNQGPGMMDIAEVLGKEEFLARIVKGLNALQPLP
jgi:glutamyl-tRNA synthetase